MDLITDYELSNIFYLIFIEKWKSLKLSFFLNFPFLVCGGKDSYWNGESCNPAEIRKLFVLFNISRIFFLNFRMKCKNKKQRKKRKDVRKFKMVTNY